METYPAVVLWTFGNLERGGCLSALDGETYLFQPWDERNRGTIRNPVYAKGFFPEPGKRVLFSIEFGQFGSREDYRVISLAPLTQSECGPEDWQTLICIYDEYEAAQFQRQFVGRSKMGGPCFRTSRRGR